MLSRVGSYGQARDRDWTRSLCRPRSEQMTRRAAKRTRPEEMVGKRLPNMAGACPFLSGGPGCPYRFYRQGPGPPGEVRLPLTFNCNTALRRLRSKTGGFGQEMGAPVCKLNRDALHPVARPVPRFDKAPRKEEATSP